MTAINPARLKIQCADLVKSFSNPDAFITGLHDLFGFYASRVRHTGLKRIPLTLQTYQIPLPVFRALETELDLDLNTHPSQGLLLIDALWEEEWLEFRQLAVIMLGNLPPINTDPILKRIKTWLSTSTSEIVRSFIPTRGILRLTSENPELVLDFFTNLLKDPNKRNCQTVLFGLLQFGSDQKFYNLPIIYSLLGKILLVEEKGLVKESQDLLTHLIYRSEQETLYFLVQQLSSASKPRILRLVRAVLPKFSAENQAILRESIQNYS